MFKTRLISGILLIIAALVSIISGGWVLFGVLLLISLIGLKEFYDAMKIEEDGKKIGALHLMGYAATILYYVFLVFGNEKYLMEFGIGVLVCFMAIYVFTFPKFHSEQIMSGYFGFFYVVVMLSYIYRTRMLADGTWLVWLIFICSWGSDTCAYCVGMLFGKHKMAPKLSPKKSIEGGIGGVIGAGLIGAIYGIVVGKMQATIANPVLIFAIIGAIGGGISQIGDLAASAIKRNHDIKDYGKLIPGHGGIMDRFDSVIFTAPIIYMLIRVFMR